MTNLLFDFDGTLHDTIRIYAPAFKAAYTYLIDNGFAESRSWRDEDISVWLGYSSRDMWNAFMPKLPEAEKARCSQIIGAEMLEALRSGKGQLYDGAAEALGQLESGGYRLLFLSNCKVGYMRESIRQFSLARYFEAFYCTEQYDFAPKYEIFQDIQRRHDGNFIAIGDRHLDIEMARLNGIASIGCLYGYGQPEELAQATTVIASPYDLVAAVRELY